MSGLQQAMDAAKEASTSVPAVQEPNTGGEVVQYGTGLDDFLSGNLQVDHWIQVKDAGIRLDRDDKAYISEFEAELDPASIQLFVGLRAEFAGNQVEYRQSNDGGKTTTIGENFNAILARWKETSIKEVKPYRGANMILVLIEDTTQGKTTLPAGTKLGYTTSVTAFYPFQKLLKELTSEGKIQDAGGGRVAGETIRVKVTHEARVNSQKQEYGILLLEVID